MLGIQQTLLTTLSLCLLFNSYADSFALRNKSAQRLRPPSPITCSRDHLTSFQGRILAYQRGKNHIRLRVRTDEETTETFNLKWSANEKAEQWFLLRGDEFNPADWKLIERAPGRLIAGMRIIVWVCDDGSKPVFDWRPKEQ